MRHFMLFTVLAFAGLTISACSTKSLVDTAAPDETVMAVPGMHWGASCEARVRAALKTLPFVDETSIKTSLASRQVSFRIRAGNHVDLSATKTALQRAGYANASYLCGPKE